MNTLEQYIILKKKTNLIFDLDETICWLLLPWDKWDEKIAPFLQKKNRHIYKKYRLGRINLSDMQNKYVKLYPNIKKSFVTHNRKFERDYLDGIIPNQPLIKFIKKAYHSKKYNLYLWSSNTSLTVTSILDKYGLSNKFNDIITRDSVLLLKPEIEGFEYLSSKSNSKMKKNYLSSFLFIGDSSSDEEAAKKAKISFFKIDYFSQSQFSVQQKKYKTANIN